MQTATQILQNISRKSRSDHHWRTVWARPKFESFAVPGESSTASPDEQRPSAAWLCARPAAGTAQTSASAPVVQKCPAELAGNKASTHKKAVKAEGDKAEVRIATAPQSGAEEQEGAKRSSE